MRFYFLALQSSTLILTLQITPIVLFPIEKSCDPADDFERIDWDDSSDLDYVCQKGEVTHSVFDDLLRIQCRPIEYPTHVCMNERIFYAKAPPLSGAHRPAWPKYGEYLYLPPQRYVGSLEHGAAVFLYHPCANHSEVDQLKKLARSCLYRHIITPSRLLPVDRPFAVLTWGCMLTLGKLDSWLIQHYIRRYATRQSPQAHIYSDGQYSRGLIRPAKVVSDANDHILCPTPREKQHIGNAVAHHRKLKTM